MTQQDQDRAKNQASAQFDSICAMIAAASLDWERLEELREARDGDFYANSEDDQNGWELSNPDEAEELAELEEQAGEYASQEEAEEAIYNNPLDIQYRSGWASSAEDLTPEEFYILLCTGGPAVRIMGELDFHGQPCRAWLEYQDWGTPWTHFFCDSEPLIDYAQRVICL